MVASSSLVYGLHTNPFPTCYVQGIGEYSCSANSNMEKLVTSQQLDPDPEQQLVERCWLSVSNYLILALFVPVVIILAVSYIRFILKIEHKLNRITKVKKKNNYEFHSKEFQLQSIFLSCVQSLLKIT